MLAFASEARLATLRWAIDNGPMFVALLDRQNRIHFINATFAQFVGCDAKELVGMEWAQIFLPVPDHHAIQQEFLTAIGSKPMRSTRFEMVANMGQRASVEWRYREFSDAHTTASGVIAIGFDVTERVKLDHDCRRADAHFQALLKTLNDDVVEVSESGVTSQCFLRREMVEGTKFVPVVGKTLAETMPSASATCCLNAIRMASKESIGHGAAFPLVTGRETRWFEPSAAPIDAPSVQQRTFILRIREITSRVEAAAGFARSEESYRQLVDNSPYSIYHLDKQGRFVSLNPAGVCMVGATHEDAVIGKKFLEYVAASDKPRLAKLLDAALGGQSVEVEFKCRNHKLVHTRFVPLGDGSINGITLDITKQRQTENALRQSESRLNDAMRIAGMGSWEYDLVTNELVWSEQIYQIFEIDPNQNVSFESFLDTVHPEDRERVRLAYFQHVEQRTPYDLEHRLLMPDGRVKYVREYCETYYDAAGNALRSLGVVHDITASKRAELEVQTARDALAHANRIGVLGEIASGLAHELNQPLTAIHLDANTANQLCQYTDQHLTECLKRISGESFRAGEIVRRMRSFIRKEPTPRIDRDINQIIREIDHLVGNYLRHKGVRVDLNLANALPAVHVDSIQIQQVLVNLLCNANDAMENNDDDPRHITIRSHACEDVVRILISDTGQGVKPTFVDKLFFPFQTTSKDGIGLGLTISRTIIESHGGRIEYQENTGRGSTFTIDLPARNPSR